MKCQRCTNEATHHVYIPDEYCDLDDESYYACKACAHVYEAKEDAWIAPFDEDE